MNYSAVHRTSYHVATIYRRRRPIISSRNRIGSRSRGCGWGDQSLHAERAVVKRLGDLSQLRGCTLEVVRLDKNNDVKGSKPCRDCQLFLEKCMREYGLRKVIYSI